MVRREERVELPGPREGEMSKIGLGISQFIEWVTIMSFYLYNVNGGRV